MKTLKSLKPYDFICKRWTLTLEPYRRDPIHQMPGLSRLGQEADIRMQTVMLDSAPPASRFVAETAHDNDAAREDLNGRGMRPVTSRKDAPEFLPLRPRTQYHRARVLPPQELQANRHTQ